MNRNTRSLAALAALLMTIAPGALPAQDPVISQILFSVQDLDSKEIVEEVPAGGDLVLRLGDRVRLRAVAVPQGSNRGRRYPSTAYELHNGAGLVSLSEENVEMGSAVLTVLKTSSRNRPNAVPFVDYEIREKLKMGPKLAEGRIYVRFAEEPTPAPQPQPAPPAPKRGVTLYEHQDFRGISFKFTEDVPELRGHVFRQDMASSVRLDRGCKVTLYEHSHYQGRATVLTEDITDLRDTRVGSDTVSSLQLECRGENWRPDRDDRDGRDDRGPRDGWGGRDDRDRRGVTLFEHQDFQGRSETFYDNDRRLNDNSSLRQDMASSVRVDRGCKAILYEHADFGGRATVVTEDLTDLNGSRVGNDSVSSIEVDCGGRR